MDEATTAGAMERFPTLAGTLALRKAASAVSALLDAGLKMDEATTAAPFRALRWTRQQQPVPWDVS